MTESTELKLYFDYKSPFAFLAVEPSFALAERFRVEVRWIPYLLRIKGKGERSIYSEWKARYSYMDARRWPSATQSSVAPRSWPPRHSMVRK